MAYAQPVASFSASATNGCAPLTNVQFTDQSSGSPTAWIWKRNGVQFSTLQNPSATFSTAGSYIIQLTASNSSGSSTFSLTINVYSKPTSNFSATSGVAGCLPFNVSFQHSATAVGTNISSWLWSFGDGGQSSQANPNHTYTLAGNFPVSLKVVDGHGCEDTKQIPNYIQVYPLPNVSFNTNSNRYACAPPVTVAFTNGSSGTGTLTYKWKFGDGNTSTAANPTHTYTSMGNYTVKLIVTDNNACSDSLSFQQFVKIQPIVADFTVSADSICLGDSVIFNNNSTNAFFYAWRFGDNTGATGYNTSHIYQDSGWFNVRLIASLPSAGCYDTIYKQVYVQQVVADFTPMPNYLCQLPQYVYYQNNSVNWDYKEWYRGLACPYAPPGQNCGTPTTQDSAFYHNLLSPLERIYADTLVVSSKLGCVDTMIKDTSVIVNLAKAGPILSQYQGCIPYSINFSGIARAFNPNVYVPNPPLTLTSFKWYIDGTPYSTLQNPPNLSVTNTGEWSGSFVIENSLGCKDSALFSYKAGDTVIADFSIQKDTICVSDNDSLFTLSQDTSEITSYKWSANAYVGEIDNGKKAYISPKGIGPISVVHIVDFNGCSDTITKVNAIYAKGPVVKFYPSLFNCIDSTKISFTSFMQQAARWYWNFGDSTIPIDSTSLNPTVLYSKQGVYYPQLTAYSADSECVYTDAAPVLAGKINAFLRTKSGIKTNDFTYYAHVDTIRGCAPMNVHFTAHESYGAHLVDWYIDSTLYTGVHPDSILTKKFSQRGFYQMHLVVYDTVANCRDTSTTIVAVYKPIADFIGNPNKGCTPLNVLLEEKVSSLNKIVSYNWNVGGILKTDPDFTAVINNSVMHNAQLWVQDAYGCRDTVNKPGYVSTSNFVIDFYASGNRLICADDSMKFIQPIPVTNVSYTWIFEPGDTVRGVNAPWKAFPDSGSFDVTLIARDSFGCIKTELKPDYIRVQAYPDPDFIAIPTDSTCYPLPVQFYADSTMPYFKDNTFLYNLGDFSAASNYQNPFYNYVRPGSYTISLIVKTPHGCRDTVTKVNYINITGPYGEMDIQPDSICRSQPVVFNIVNPINVGDYGWDFGDGNVVMNTSPVTHEYLDSIGKLVPTLFFSDSIGGCSKTFSDTVYIFETDADFSMDTIRCVPYKPVIKNNSIGVSKYEWSFGDGSTSGQRKPVKVYENPGQYLVELHVKGNGGCKDSAFLLIDVHPVPVAFAETDTLLCEGDSVQLLSGGGETYLWTPNTSLSNHVIFNPIAFPTNTLAYEVLVTDTNGCEDKDSVFIIIQNPIYVDLVDLTMVVGDTVTLFNAYGGPGVHYQWIPPDGLSCDTCARPKLTALQSKAYTVIISDTNGCFQTATNFYLEVLDKYTVDVPQAFTPNGDGINDIVYVRGWGIKELVTFKIYNRWGEMIFESNDLSIGWDGTYKGSLQGVETFVYYVEVITYGEEVLTKKGNINLLK